MWNIPRKTAVVQAVFTVELDHQALLQIRRALAHDLGIRILKDIIATDLDVTLSRHDPQSGLGSEVDQLATEVTLVLRNTLVQ